VKRVFVCMLVVGTIAGQLAGVATAATKKTELSTAQRHKLTELARAACRKKFGGGVTLRDIEFFHGKIKKIWCY
jgi:hypothetical protein